jgi:hypothetical protein
MNRATLLLAVLAMFSSTSAYADVIFSQPLTATPTGQFGYSSELPPNTGTTQVIADNFSLASAASVRDVQWWGIYQNGSTPGQKSFSIQFFNDSPGTPGTLISGQTVSVTGVATGFNNFGGDPILFYDSAIAPVPLNAATNYWISIADNDATSRSLWAWQFSDGGDGSEAVSLDNEATWQNGRVIGGQGMAFTAAVPEPASLTLLGLTSLAAAGYGWRRRKASQQVA